VRRGVYSALSEAVGKEFGLEVHPSYEGWGAGYEPHKLPTLEAWAKGEIEEVESSLKKPRGILFDVRDTLRRSDDEVLNLLRYEVLYLLESRLSLWRFGQREVFRAGYVPTSFLVLFSVLERLRTAHLLREKHPSSFSFLRKFIKETISGTEAAYPYHRLALGVMALWLGETKGEGKVRSLERGLWEYLREKDQSAGYEIVIEDLWQKFRAFVDRSRELNFVDLILEEARGVKEKEGHKGRIMTDILSKLPPALKEAVNRNKEKRAEELPEELLREVLRALEGIPDWMKDYLKQMSYLDLLEKDLRFLQSFLPRTLEVDVEHRGFITFLFKSWEEGASSSSRRREKKELGERDRKFQKEFGLTEEEFRLYRNLLREVLPFVENFKKKFESILPKKEELWDGRYYRGKRLNMKRISTEVAIKRGRVFCRREVPTRKELIFELLLDVSSSMKKEEKIISALKSVLLFSEVLNTLGMKFAIKVFNDRVSTLKDYEEDYESARGRIMDLVSFVGGSTNLGEALSEGVRSLEREIRKRGVKGVLVLFTDGQPTKGLKGPELRYYISRLKRRVPVVAVGVGNGTDTVREYFEKNSVSVPDISRLPVAFFTIIENQLRKLVSVN